VSRSAITALASAIVVRPDGGATPPALEAAIRGACAAAWSALEVALAGKSLVAALSDRDARLREACEGVIGVTGAELRATVIEELRSARTSGELDARFDLPTLLAGCGRVGDSPVVQSARRRVRSLAIDQLRAGLASRRALAGALGETALAALLVDTARAGFRLAARDERTLAPWTMPPTGTTTRDRLLTTFCELTRDPALLAALDRVIAASLGPPNAATPEERALPPLGEPPQEAVEPPPPPTAAAEPAPPPADSAGPPPDVQPPASRAPTPPPIAADELKRSAPAPLAAPRSWLVPAIIAVLVTVAAVAYLVH
jgi:hypothetical protein